MGYAPKDPSIFFTHCQSKMGVVLHTANSRLEMPLPLGQVLGVPLAQYRFQSAIVHLVPGLSRLEVPTSMKMRGSWQAPAWG